MRIGALFTGGKDSTYSLYLASKANLPVCLMNAESRNKDSYMFHTVGSRLLGLQAEAMGLPLERFATEGEKERELDDLKSFIIQMRDKYKLEGVVSGAIASEYQRSRISKILQEAGLESMTPLWHVDVGKYLRDFISDGFKAVIVSVSADGLGKEWLNKELDSDNLDRLEQLSKEYRFHMGFEGGEAETAVLDGPNFSSRITIGRYRIVSEGQKHYLDIEDAFLSRK
jgi:ABC transporter with metal-binding/Fe-S-binding domain ATP-binding protein